MVEFVPRVATLPRLSKESWYSFGTEALANSCESRRWCSFICSAERPQPQTSLPSLHAN